MLQNVTLLDGDLIHTTEDFKNALKYCRETFSGREFVLASDKFSDRKSGAYTTDGIRPSTFNSYGIHYIFTPHHYDNNGELVIDGLAYYHRKYGPALIREKISLWYFNGENVTPHIYDWCANYHCSPVDIPKDELDVLYLVYGQSKG